MRRKLLLVAPLLVALTTAVALLATAVQALPALAYGADTAIVHTDAGPVRGTVTADHREFLGIPYAAPPVGELRWASPQPPARWTAPRDATTSGNRCVQKFLPPYLPGQSEDCLYLNVTTPRHRNGGHMPVMLWFHPGGFTSGSGSEIMPTTMAVRGDVIVVTINYRLGVLGFLDLPALDGGLAEHKSGNFGVEDQQAALRWIQRNATAFGGDPHNVTIFGQWSGGRGVCVQLAAPGAAGLFQRAITMSNPCMLNRIPKGNGAPDPHPLGLPRPRSDAESRGQAFATAVGCVDPAVVAACLRGKSAEELVAHADYLVFTPVYGEGGVLPINPIDALVSGQFTRVPMMVGTNRNGFRISDAFLEEFGFPPLTVDGYLNRVRNFVGPEHADEVLARYPLAQYDNVPSLAWSAIGTDALLARPQVDTQDVLAGYHVPTYTYEFADENAPWYAGAPLPSFPPGSYQDAELQYLFDTTYYAGQALTPEQRQLSDTMIDYWTRFAHAGDPNGPALPYWPAADRSSDSTQVFAPGPGGIYQVDFSQEHSVDFWRTLQP